jgi:hypothetical protein
MPAKRFESLATQYAKQLKRSSVRDMPKLYFSHGILGGGRMMAKEHRGVLLVILISLRSAKGKAIVKKCKAFKNNKKKNYNGDAHLDDWITLLETLLQWDSWLRQPEMAKKHVKLLQEKHKRLMWMIYKVGRKLKGMGLKTAKYHGILHIVQCILDFGVPMLYDSSQVEAHHKDSKKAATLTQKNKVRFNQQTAQRLKEMNLLALAEEEINGRPLWHYFAGHEHDEEGHLSPEEEEDAPELGGETLQCSLSADGELQLTSDKKIKGKRKDILMEVDFIDFVGGLEVAVRDHYNCVRVHTQHRRLKSIFRASTDIWGGVWRDWVVVDWGYDGGKLPAKLWGFVDLRALPENSGISYGGLGQIDPGMYAIVESSTITDENHDKLFRTIETEVGEIQGNRVSKLKFYLADVEAIADAAVVAPDIGGKPNAYFWMRPPSEWPDMFEEWLEAPLENDDFVDETDDPWNNNDESEDESDDDEEDEGGEENDQEEDEEEAEEEEEDSDDEEENHEADSSEEEEEE